MRDPYEILGVARSATTDEIRKAYRSLAKKLHPDLNPGVAAAEERFKEVSNAYDVVGDEEKRKRFDAGEIDAAGAERPKQRYYRDFASGQGEEDPYETSSGFADFGGSSDIFAELFGRQARRSGPVRGGDVRYELSIGFLDAINGAVKRIAVPGGTSLDLTIPPGAQDGLVLRLRGKGTPGDGEPGDAIVEISVAPHRFFTRHGDDIHLELPVTLTEAVLGARVKAPTPSGTVMLTIPKGSNTGALLRLKGKGAPRRGGHGDELVKLKVMLPAEPNADLESFLATWAPDPAYDPRQDMQA